MQVRSGGERFIRLGNQQQTAFIEGVYSRRSTGNFWLFVQRKYALKYCNPF